jgi:signal transduction histidine kinase
MELTLAYPNLQFLRGGGAMGELTRNYNWINSSIGEPGNWHKVCRQPLACYCNQKCLWFYGGRISWYMALDMPRLAYTRISIEDNGIGFAPMFSASIFKTFTRLHTRESYEGTGLGLSLCKKIVDWHGGHISARGNEMQGQCLPFYCRCSNRNKLER